MKVGSILNLRRRTVDFHSRLHVDLRSRLPTFGKAEATCKARPGALLLTWIGMPSHAVAIPDAELVKRAILISKFQIIRRREKHVFHSKAGRGPAEMLTTRSVSRYESGLRADALM